MSTIHLESTERPRPPCSFCGSRANPVSIGFRAIICNECILAIGTSLQAIERQMGADVAETDVAGAECAFCERILSSSRFSLHRWIFGICDVCACSVSGSPIRYTGASPRGFRF
jgi:hypothetical protein